MCEHGTLTTVTIRQKPFEVPIDSCIADEIVWLNEQGVRTVGSCCGHGERKPTALIDTDHGSLKFARQLGYVPGPYSGLFYEITLKGKRFRRNEK